MTGDPGAWYLAQMLEIDERVSAALDARLWGFPREVSEVEINYGAWFRMGQEVIHWFELPHPDRPHDLPLHLVVDPKVRHKWPVRRWHYLMQGCAELIGARRVRGVPFDEDWEMLSYCLRMGWTQESDGFILELGG